MNRKTEGLARLVCTVLGMASVVCVLAITLYLILSGLPAIQKIGLGDFLFGPVWAPSARNPQYGILPLLLSSLAGMAGALAIGVPTGLLVAVYLEKLAPARIRRFVFPFIELLAGIPSVVYGLVGMFVLVPGIRVLFHVPDGSGLLAAIVVLSVLILPGMVSLSCSALKAVDPAMEQASLAMGADPVQTAFKISVPCARRGIANAVVLSAGRALGEAMAVMMVCGNVANWPAPFSSVKFLTTAVAGEMSYAYGLQREALFSIALVLFVLIFLLNVAVYLTGRKGKA